MSELILTPEEEAAELYTDLDNESLGKLVKHLLLEQARILNSEEQLDYCGVVGLLIHCLRNIQKFNAGKARMLIENLHIKGENIGSWEMILRNIDDADDIDFESTIIKTDVGDDRVAVEEKTIVIPSWLSNDFNYGDKVRVLLEKVD